MHAPLLSATLLLCAALAGAGSLAAAAPALAGQPAARQEFTLVTLNLYHDRDDWPRRKVRVHDDGIGIAPEMLPRILELFMQGDGGLARTEGGLGVGLTLARRIVEMHGGSIEASSEGMGCGANFQVRLPALEQATPLAQPPAIGQPGSATEVRTRLHRLAAFVREHPQLGPEARDALAELLDELSKSLASSALAPGEVSHIAETTAHLVEAAHQPEQHGVLAAGRVIESQLFGITARDPLSLALAAMAFAAAGLLAIWWPSRRAGALDPAIALRAE